MESEVYVERKRGNPAVTTKGTKVHEGISIFGLSFVRFRALGG